MAKRIQVGGRIESKEVGGIVTGAAEILDDAKGKKQSVINGETDDELLRLDQSKQDNLTFDNAPTEGSNNPVKSGGVYAADKALSDAIEAILLLIPSAASALNKLVDTSMMNSSISTATATFRGTYNVVTDLSLTVDATHEQIAAALGNAISTADDNDYAFVQIPVSEESTDIRRTERYKFNGTAWGYEYDLNTSGFTAAQWAAINSGITLALVGKLIGLPTSSELQALLGQKQNTLTFDNVPTAGSANPVNSGGVHTAINDEKTAREQLANTVTGIDGRVENIEKVIPTGAADNNKLVANSSMEAYVTSIIEAITASFTIATADGHINFTLTQTNGRVASLTLTSSDIASAQALTALTGRVSTAEGNITTLGVRVSTNETDIANLQQLYNNLQQSKPVPVTELPSTGQQQGVIYRLAGTTSYSDYMCNGSTWVLMATYNNAIDPRPKKASQNLVTSGGVFDNMGALDVSELNATENPHTLAQYVDLSTALAAVPTEYQKGGMSIKFVQSSDNNYVQFRCKTQSFSLKVYDWVNEDEEIENVKGASFFYYLKNQKLSNGSAQYTVNIPNWNAKKYIVITNKSANDGYVQYQLPNETVYTTKLVTANSTIVEEIAATSYGETIMINNQSNRNGIFVDIYSIAKDVINAIEDILPTKQDSKVYLFKDVIFSQNADISYSVDIKSGVKKTLSVTNKSVGDGYINIKFNRGFFPTILVTSGSTEAIEVPSYVETNSITVKSLNSKNMSTSLYYEISDIEKELNNNNKGHTGFVVVDANGRGDFTDINSAITWLNSNFDTVNVPTTIFVRNGLYVVEPSATSQYYAAIKKGNNKISIIGESKDGVIIKCTNTASVQNKVLDIGGDCAIKNLSIYCLRDSGYTIEQDLGHNPYALHVDDGTFEEPYNTVIENCYFYSECFEPIGAGLRKNQKQIYRNVVCVNNGFQKFGFYCHAPQQPTWTGCSVELDGVTYISQNEGNLLGFGDVQGSIPYTEIPVTIRRSIFVTNGTDTSASTFKATHALTMDSALNNIPEVNF